MSSEKPNDQKFFNNIQAGRGVAALSVLLYHANVITSAPKYFGHEVAPMFRAGGSGVEFFFVLSGLIMVLAHRTELGAKNSMLKFWWKRFRRIYLPLWVVLGGLVGALLLLPSVIPGGTAPLKTTIAAFLVIPMPDERILAVEWTLRHEIMFYLLFSVMLWKPRLGLGLIVLWSLASIFAAIFPLHYPLSFIFDPVHLLFLFGMAAAYFVSRGFVYRPLALFVCGLTIFAAVWIAICVGWVTQEHPSARWGLGFGAALSLVGAIGLERHGRMKAPLWLVFLGEASYSIYLVHYPVLSLASKVALVLSRHISLPIVGWLTIDAMAALCAGIAFHLVVEQPLLRLTGTRLGLSGRKARAATGSIRAGPPSAA